MKKNKVCIVVDSSSGLKNLELEHVYMIPLSLIETGSNKKEILYKDLEEISSVEILDKLKNRVDLKTSQASIGLKIDLLEKLVTIYDDIYVIPISSGISGSYDTWLMLQKEFLLQNKSNIYIVNANDIFFGIQSLILDIKKLINENKTPQQILEYAKKRQSKFYGVLIVQDPSQLKKGGRIGSFKAILVKALKINLLIGFNGKLEYFDKQKSNEKSIDSALKKIDAEIKYKSNKIKNAFLYSTFQDESRNKELIDRFEKELNCKVKWGLLPPSISIHTGDDAYCIIIETF